MKVHIGNFPKDPSKEQKVKIKIDPWDSYAGYHTLALIIHPLLVDFRKKSNKGIPGKFLDDMGYDFSENVKNSVFNKRKKEWNAVIDKMIWSFRETANDYPGEKKAFKKNGKKYKTKIRDDGYHEVVETGLDYDRKVYEEYQKRLQEGIDLFAKYYGCLWW